MSDVIPIRGAPDLAIDIVPIPVLGQIDQRRALLAQGPYSAFDQALSRLDEVVQDMEQDRGYVCLGRLGTAHLGSNFVGIFPSSEQRPAPRLLVRHYKDEQLVHEVYDVIPEPTWTETAGLVVMKRRYSGMPNHEKVNLLDDKRVSARKALSLTHLISKYKLPNSDSKRA